MTPPAMRNIASAVVMAAGVSLAAPPAFSQDIPADFTQIVAEMTPSVVAITTRRLVERQDMSELIPPGLRERFQERFGRAPPEEGAQPRQAQAQGSGFLISQDGHIVTNSHVIQDATEIRAILADGTTVPAELVGADPATDLAVLRIETTQDMVIAEWGDSDAMRPGAWTIAIGSPFGLGGSVTVGVLSAMSRDIRSGPYDDYLQTDASINQGNSGGPLFNAGGEVIGVNTAIFSPTGVNVGIGFAVPSRTARLVITELIETGEVRRGYIGVFLQPLTEPMARALGMDGVAGALISQVEPGGPAEAAGLVAGDVVLGLEGRAVADPRALSFAVAERDPDEEVRLTIQRGGERMDVAMTLGSRDLPQTTSSIGPGASPEPASGEGELGLAIAPLPGAVRQELGIAEGGVAVESVEPGGIAAEGGLQEADIILEADEQAVNEQADLTRAWDTAREDGRPMLLRIQRGNALLFAALEG